MICTPFGILEIGILLGIGIWGFVSLPIIFVVLL